MFVQLAACAAPSLAHPEKIQLPTVATISSDVHVPNVHVWLNDLGIYLAPSLLNLAGMQTS